MTDLVIRALTEDDTHLFHTLPDPGLVGRSITGVDYRTFAEGGDYRPEWTRVALRDGRVVARAAWWGGPDDSTPLQLNWFDVAEGEEEAGAELLRSRPYNVEYQLILPPDWRDDPAVKAAAETRIATAEAAGMRLLVERYRYEWRPEHGLPMRQNRLTYRPEPDDAVLLDVLRRVHSVTLDAHALLAVKESGLDTAAQEELDYIHWVPSPRDWVRLAHTPDGELVGIHVPVHIPAGPCVGFIGVVPEQRGRGYAYDLLAECTHFLVAEGAQLVIAATDKGNLPMAGNFAKAGYPVIQERVDLV
jgi:RimJ/RimL family protein N-acetyltransferase